jgi:hypothetical protein
MIRISARRFSRLSLFVAAMLGVGGLGIPGLVCVASAQEPEGYGVTGYTNPTMTAPGFGGAGYSGPGYGYGGCASCGGGGGGCNECQTCNTHHCPPKLQHCMEGPPRIHVKIGCPKPICNPCTQPNWGYYEKCWNPWPFPPNWSHCPSPPPAATVVLAERAYGGLTPFYGPDPNAAANPAVTTPMNPYPTAPAVPQPTTPQPARPYMQPMPQSPPPMSPPSIRTTPPPMPVPTPMPPMNPGAASIPSPLDTLPVPRQETLRPTPGLDGF